VAEFDANKQLNLKGVVTKIEWMNPHTYFYVDTKPFTIRWDIPWDANGELAEYICQENNKYLQRLTDDFGQPIFGKKQ
jgi:hypothetical protein